MRCSVDGCMSSNTSKNFSRSGLKFYSFPKNIVFCKKWIHATGRTDKFNVQYAGVCSKHFDTSAYKLRNQLLDYSPKHHRGLTDDAVPTLHIPIQALKMSGNRSLQEIERKQLVEEALNSTPTVGVGLSIQPSNTNSAGVVYKIKLKKISELSDKNLQSTACVSDGSSLNQPNTSDCNVSNYERLVDNTKPPTTVDIGIQTNASKTLQEQALELERHLKSLTEKLTSIEKIFSKKQIEKISANKRILWNITDISKAIVLHSAGPRAYNMMLRDGYPFPAPSTLQSWLKKLKLAPGILKNVFKIVEYSELEDVDRVCTIIFNEMKLRDEYIYDRVEDEVLKPYSSVQVVMLIGLFKSWKQPTYFNYDTPITKEILFEIIKFVESAGFHVVGVNGKLGGCSKLIEELDVSCEKPYFTNPVNEERIYVFADVPSLMQQIYYHFINSGFIVNGKEINKSILECAIDFAINSDFKITKSMLDIEGAQKQQLSNAKMIFSHSCSEVISGYGIQGHFAGNSDWMECSNYFKLVDDWYHTYNTSAKTCYTSNKHFGLSDEDENVTLDEMSQTTLTMRVKGTNSLLPFQKGILMSNASLKSLCTDLQRRFATQSIAIQHLNQDPLDSFFGVIQPKNALHEFPNALEFKYRLRSYIMGGGYSEHTDLKVTDTPDLTISGEFIHKLNSKNDPVVTPADTDENLEPNLVLEFAHDELENLAGFICNKLRTSESKNTTKEVISHHPSEDFLLKMQQLDEVFQSANGETLLVGKSCLKNLLIQSAHVDCPANTKKLFFKSRIYLRIKELKQQPQQRVVLGKRKISDFVSDHTYNLSAID